MRSGKFSVKHRILLPGVLFFASIVVTGCPKDKKFDTRLTIQNTSGKQLVYFYSSAYPDTTLIQFDHCSTDDIAYVVKAYSKRNAFMNSSWEQYLKEIPSGTMMIYLVDRDSAEAYSGRTGTPPN